MGNVIEDSWDTYKTHINLVLLFSIPFVISLIIPLLAPLPTYTSIGGIFLRTTSIFSNADPIVIAVIIVSLFLSLLFISFAFVAISLIVKAKRTKTKNPRHVLWGIEKHTSRVFVILLLYFLMILIANIIGYFMGIQAFLTGLVGFAAFFLMFFAPTAVVIDDKRVVRALKDGFRITMEWPRYFIIWLAMMFLAVSALDYAIIALAGNVLSSYIVLVLSSLFVLPYFVIFQAEAYMKRFHLLRH
jgi:MFS family permease